MAQKLQSKSMYAELMGAETMLYSKLGDQDFVARVDSRTDIKPLES